MPVNKSLSDVAISCLITSHLGASFSHDPDSSFNCVTVVGYFGMFRGFQGYVKLLLHHLGMSKKKTEFSIQCPSQSCGSNLLHGTSALVGLLFYVLVAFLRDFSVASASSSTSSSVGIKSSSPMLGFSSSALTSANSSSSVLGMQ